VDDFWVLKYLNLKFFFLKLRQVVEIINHQKVWIVLEVVKVFFNGSMQQKFYLTQSSYNFVWLCKFWKLGHSSGSHTWNRGRIKPNSKALALLAPKILQNLQILRNDEIDTL
jgi:hypothetical protein